MSSLLIDIQTKEKMKIMTEKNLPLGREQQTDGVPVVNSVCYALSREHCYQY